MPETAEKELARQIKNGKLAPVYLIYGDEPYLKRTYVNRIISAAVTDFADINLHRFDSSAKVDDICAAADALPMLSERSCVVVRDFNFGAVNDKDAQRLSSVINEPNGACVLIFVYENAELPQKTAKAKQILADLKKSASCVCFAKRTERELCDAACRRAARLKVNLQPTVARYLISRCGDDLENLLTEVDKLCDYAGAGSAVTEKEVDEISVRTVEASAFRLGDAVCAGNRDEALSICSDLFDMRTDPLMIIGALSSVFVDLYRVKLAEAEGLRPESVGDDFGYGKSAFRLRRAAQAGRRMSQTAVYNALEILRRADLSLKTSRADPRIVIERMTVELMRAVSGAGV